MKAISLAGALILALSSTMMLPVTASAASLSTFLTTSNESSVFPSGTDYLQVTVSDGAAGAIDFLVETTPALRDLADSNFGIQSFSFNFAGGEITADNLVLPDGWRVKGGNEAHSIFGNFDLTVQGTGRTRKDPLSFSILGISGDTPEDYLSELSSRSTLFAAHVAGFTLEGRPLSRNSGITSAQFGGGSVVPIPAAAWLMLSGLGVIFARAKIKPRAES